MPTKGMNRAKFDKLTAMMDSPSRAEAIAAFGLALDELAKEQDARFSTEYSLGNPDAEEAAQEMSRLRAQLAEAFESVARHETTTKQLEETIDRLHESMSEIDDHFQPIKPPNPVRPPNPTPSPVQPPPVMPFDWGAGNELTLETPQPPAMHSESFTLKTLSAWVYGFAVVFWFAMVFSPALRNTFSTLFLPLLFVVSGVPTFLCLRKVREAYGWIGVAVKICLTAELIAAFTVLCGSIHWEMPVLTTREEVFSFGVFFGLIWLLYSERFLLWVLDDRKRTQFIVFPGTALILLLVVAWVTASDNRPVKAAAPPQRFSQSPPIRKHHPAPKPTPPPDDPPQKLDYDFELPARMSSAPVLLQTSYSPTADRLHLIASAFQTSAPSEDGPGGFVFFLLALAVVVILKLASGESKAQKREKYRKALDEANAPLAINETGNAGHASTKDLKKRGWA